MRRKLAAILFADIAGYSRLMGADEQGTHDAVQDYIGNYVRPVVDRCGGRIVKTLGDGVLAEFESAVNSVLCAVAVQDTLEKRNRAAAAEKRLHFRIGINLGDIMIEADDVFGDGVNVASRIQALAEEDGIVVSQTVYQQVRGKVPVAFEDLGEHVVKNIVDPVRIFRVIEKENAQQSVGETVPGAEQRLPGNPSIAVLAFINLSGDPEQEYFSDGITEDIITELSRFRTISVIARNSSFSYRGKSVDVKDIGKALNVQFIVEGSVRKFDQRVRITVQLINASTRHHIWADRYDVDLSGIFAVQDDVTRRIVAAIIPKIETEELEMARRLPTGHPRAYDLYLRGKASFNAATDERTIMEAREHFEKAIAIDPEFAGAYCYLAQIENNLTMYSGAGLSLAPFRERAWNFAHKAAAIDDCDAHTQICLAWCHLWRREFEAARKHLDLAARLNPNDADRAMDRGTTLMYLGDHDEAIATMTMAIRLNPYHPDAYLSDLAEAYFVARRYGEMLELSRQIADSSPRFAAWKAAAYAYLGDDVAARREAALFVTNVRLIWRGDPAAATPQYVTWLRQFSPFRLQEDLDHFLLGLRKSGLAD